MNKIRIVIIIFVYISCLSCKDEILLSSDTYKPVLVINGKITNENPPYRIELFYSSPVGYPVKIPISNCTVMLIENSKNSEQLTEIGPGIYSNSIDGIKGTIGNKYKLEVTIPNGTKYETEYQEMKNIIKINSIYSEFIKLEHQEYIYGLPGCQFYVDTKEASDKDYYLLWNMIETYQYTSDYPLVAIWDGFEFLFVKAGQVNEADYPFRCWKSANSGYIFTATTENLINKKITHHPLHFVGTNTKRLQERYSLLVKQYSLNKEAYEYWNKIEEQTSNENFLAVTQPYNVIGNLKNINNPDETIFGYFTVASVDQKRIFVDRPRAKFYYEMCKYGLSQKLNRSPIFFTEVKIQNEFGEYFTILATVNEQCINCRSDGGENVKPDFWIDK